MVDQRHTLPNLKYLLTVLTAGKGDLPLRKKGGAKVLESDGNFIIGEQSKSKSRASSSESRSVEAEKSPLTLANGKRNHYDSDRSRIADEIRNT